MTRTKQTAWKSCDEKILQKQLSFLADYNDKNDEKNDKKILRKVIKWWCKSESMCRL